MVSTYADVPNRLVAFVVDAVLSSALVFLAAALMALVTGPVVAIEPDAESLGDIVRVDDGLVLAHAALSIAVGAAYFVGSWRTLGGSPGMRLFGMRVAGADGLPLAWRAAAIRWALLVVPFGAASAARVAVLTFVVALWYAVLLVTAARSPVKQGLHDRVAGSVVAKDARAAERAPHAR